MRYLRILVCVTGIAGMFGANLRAADVVVIEEIVCKVNGDIITRTELERDRKDAEIQLRGEGLAGRALQEAVNGASRDLLAKRIDELLLVQKGKELDLKVDNELSRQLATIQRNPASPIRRRSRISFTKRRGMPFEDYKGDLKNNILKNRVIRQEVGGSLKVKREELEKYYNDHKEEFQRKEQIFLRGIFISTEGKDAAGIAAADRKARDVARRAIAGEKFVELAQINSDLPTASNGGDMPPFQRDELRKDIADAVWEQPRGFVTQPIRTSKGFRDL